MIRIAITPTHSRRSPPRWPLDSVGCEPLSTVCVPILLTCQSQNLTSARVGTGSLLRVLWANNVATDQN
jgi:hypothetical protein